MIRKNKIITTILFGVFTGVIAFSGHNPVEATNSDYRAFVGCTPLTTAQVNDINANYATYVSAMGLPMNITVGGKSYGLNKTYMMNDCAVVYGSPATYPNQVTSTNGKPIFLGYGRNGTPYADPTENTWDPNQFYFRDQRLVKFPWLSTSKDPLASETLAVNISKSSVKPPARNTSFASPNAVDGVTLTRIQELARINDFIYWTNSNRSLGKIGYLNKVNTYTGVQWTPSVLSNYASVELYPTDYSVGYMNVYTYAPGFTYFYSNHIMPAHKLALRDLEPNLKIEITSVSNTAPKEGSNVVVNYRITNNGKIPVTNPVITKSPTSPAPVNTVRSATINPGNSITGSINVTMPLVSANKTQQIKLEVNKSRTNPTKEKTYTDNIATRNVGIVNITSGGNLTVTANNPVYPRSKQNTTISYQICNTGNTTMTNISTALNWPRETAVPGATFASIAGQNVTYNTTTGAFTTTPGECRTLSSTIPAPDTAEVEKTTAIKVTSSNGLTGTRQVTIRNPNAILNITNHKQGTSIQERELGDLKATVTNNMFKTITQNCLTVGCENSTERSFVIKFFDVTGAGKVEIPASGYVGTYNITHGNQETFTLTNSKNAIMNYINANGKKITRIKVEGNIPFYTGEYDVHGDPMYADNKEDFEIQYIPPRPDVANAACEVINHPSASHLNTNGGPSLVKACMGHFPNNPSTLVERGAQSYNYVLYRFHPLPLPRYDVYSPELNEKNPNYFYQVINSPNDNRVQGSDSSYIFKTLAGGVYKERGRYLPTSATFNFNIEKLDKDGTVRQKNGVPDVIAAGTVSYDIPPVCYEENSLDMKYHYGCGEIMMFLPNTDANKFVEPNNYNQADVNSRNINYPISQTKIPYLNPGKYRFDLTATETFRYYKQNNNNYDPGTYNWSKIE